MELSEIMEFVEVVLICVLGALSLYFKHSEKAQTKAREVEVTLNQIKDNTADFIARAEKEYASVSNKGAEKFEYVVTGLYHMVPEALRPIITREMIGNIVQNTFDEIEEYAKMQLDKHM